MTKYAIGVDFGTESGRAILVDVADGGKWPPPFTLIRTVSSTKDYPTAAFVSNRIGRCRTPKITCALSE